MNIYVAGKFENKELILDIYRKLEKMDHSISYDWTTHKFIKPYVENQKMAIKYSSNELKGIANCDIFIYLSDKEGHTLPMEFGAAVMLKKTTGKPVIYAVGKFNGDSPWFFNPLVKRRETLEEVLEELKEVKSHHTNRYLGGKDKQYEGKEKWK